MGALATGSRLMTAEELLQLPRGRWRSELVRGELRQMSPSGHVHGRTALEVGARLWAFVREHRLGVTYAAETGFLLRRDPDTVRAPDVAFVTNATLAARTVSPEGFFPGAPDLAVEVISPSDSYSEVEEKVAEWLDAGTQVVVVLDPRRKVATVYRSGADTTTLAAADQLSLPDLLPGWSLSLEEIFR